MEILLIILYVCIYVIQWRFIWYSCINNFNNDFLYLNFDECSHAQYIRKLRWAYAALPVIGLLIIVAVFNPSHWTIKKCTPKKNHD